MRSVELLERSNFYSIFICCTGLLYKLPGIEEFICKLIKKKKLMDCNMTLFTCINLKEAVDYSNISLEKHYALKLKMK